MPKTASAVIMNERERKKQRNEYRNLRRGYYHMSTDGLKDMQMFYTPAQFAYCTIVLGLITLKFGVSIYSYSLMPNHVHIILSGTGANCVNAFDYLHRKISARLKADGYPPLPRDYGFKLVPIESEEQMRRNIIYVDRNSYEKMICVPGGYLWGTCHMQFSQIDLRSGARRADTFSLRELKTLTCSHESIPGHWLFHPVAGLLPESFVETSLFKKLFRTPKEYAVKLVKDYEAYVQVAKSLGEENEFSPEEQKDLVHTILRSGFGGKDLGRLSSSEKGKLCVILYKEYNLAIEAIAKLVGLSEHLVTQFLRAKDYGKIREIP